MGERIIFNADRTSEDLEQLAFYDDGVGAERQPGDTDGSALSDLTFAWMRSTAKAPPGVHCDPVVTAKYTLPTNPALAPNIKLESWNVLWSIPKRRIIGPNSFIANSVHMRAASDTSYRPENFDVHGKPAGFRLPAGPNRCGGAGLRRSLVNGRGGIT
jgi:hypothetical protein